MVFNEEDCLFRLKRQKGNTSVFVAIWVLYELSEKKEYGRIFSWSNRVAGCVGLYS